MECVICQHGETAPGETTITLERGPTTLVIKGVPAEVCGNCGEAYVDEVVTEALLAEVERAASQGVGVEIRRYAA
ncbi:MAG: type II toxin-antitoxin system MqsA family antitoxin [Acidobacteria bacterium]|nr:type II toxin-antitoxin system MqsA family antitoxin [Acidobacteriota bacterium]